MTRANPNRSRPDLVSARQSAPRQRRVGRSVSLALVALLLVLSGPGFVAGFLARTHASQQEAGVTTRAGDEVGSGRTPASDTPPHPSATGNGEEFYAPLGSIPQWILDGDHMDADSQTRYLVVQSEKCLRRREAEAELNERLLAVVRQKVDEWFAPGAAEAIGVDLHYIHRNLVVPQNGDDKGVHTQVWQWKVPEENVEMIEAELGDSYQCSALVALDREFSGWARNRWEDQLVRSRTLQVALFVLSCIVLVSLVFGYFQANHKTRGFYSRRLQTVTLLLSLVMVVMAVILSGLFPWL